jgi:hypothetical protein
VQGGAPDIYIDGDTVAIGGTAQSPDTCIAAVTINGVPANISGSGSAISFDAALSFADLGTDDVTIVVEVTDCQGHTTTLTYTAHRDVTAPVLSIQGLALAPSVNQVIDQPYRLEGTVVEKDLSSLTVNGQSLTVLPSGAANTYSFNADLELARGAQRSFTIEARDLAGNATSRAVVLLLQASLDIDIVSPRPGQELIASGATGPVTVSARITGMDAGDVVEASLDGGNTITLSRSGSSVEGTFSNVEADAPHSIGIGVKSSAGTTLAQSSVNFSLTNQESIPLMLVKQEPANNAAGVETNQFIAWYFNRPMDLGLLEVEVRETAHGKTYAAGGTDILTFSQVSLVDVNRSQEPVPGNATNMPGNTMITFYPSRDYAYGAQISVDVRYDGANLVHSQFNVRSLPTLVQGFVADQNGEPLSSIDVIVPALGLSTTTNADGNYDFGWGRPASEVIPPGSYRALINPYNKNPRYGSLERFIHIRDGETNSAGVTRIPRLDRGEAFRFVVSGQPAAQLARGDLTLDLSNAVLTFPDAQDAGPMHAQLMDRDRIPYAQRLNTPVDFGFAIEPSGIAVAGAVQVEAKLPRFQNSFDYVDSMAPCALMLAVDPASLELVPVGVFEVDKANLVVRTVGQVHLSRLDYIAFGRTTEAGQVLCDQYARDEITIQQLVSGLEATP